MRKLFAIAPDNTELVLSIVMRNGIMEPSLQGAGNETHTEGNDHFRCGIHPQTVTREVPQVPEAAHEEADDYRALSTETIANNTCGYFKENDRQQKHGVNDTNLTRFHATVFQEQYIGRKRQRKEESIKDLEQEEIALDFVRHDRPLVMGFQPLVVKISARSKKCVQPIWLNALYIVVLVGVQNFEPLPIYAIIRANRST